MDQHVEKTPAMHLSAQPSVEKGLPGFGDQQGAYHRPESAAMMAAELPPPTAMVPPTLGQAGAQSSPFPAASGVPVPQMPSTATAAVPADNNSDDDLDEEWVRKAKAIVEKTRHDPFIQSKEIGQVKADYLRIRHNKQIKVAQDKAQ